MAHGRSSSRCEEALTTFEFMKEFEPRYLDCYRIMAKKLLVISVAAHGLTSVAPACSIPLWPFPRASEHQFNI